MSYLHVLDCHCQIGGSADVESVGGIDALLTNEEASVFALLETSSELASPCRSDTKFEFPDVVFTIGERGPDRYPPLYGVHTDFDVEIRVAEPIDFFEKGVRVFKFFKGSDCLYVYCDFDVNERIEINKSG